jgi:molybdopterin converting factor small subunit
VAVLVLFAAARQVAGTGRDEIPGTTVAEVLAGACQRFGPAFSEVLASSRVWVNGAATTWETAVGDEDEVAVLPPVSGGST